MISPCRSLNLLAVTFLIFLASKPACLKSQNVAVNTSGTAAASTNMLEVTQTSTAAYMVALYAIHSGANAATDTGYAFKAIKTGATGNNVAGYFSATGGGNNYAIVVPRNRGYVGIGTVTPKGILHIENGEAKVTFYDTDAAGPSAARPAWQVGASGTYYVVRSSADYTAYTDRMAILPSGDAGIGTSAPAARLHIYNGASGNTMTSTYSQLDIENAGDAGIMISNPDASIGRILFGSPSRQYGALFRWDYSNSNLDIGTDLATGNVRFLTANFSEKMRISSAGNVGIGTTNPLSQLHTTGTVRFANYPSSILATDASGILQARSIAVSGNGVAVTNGNGAAGNPTLNLNYGSSLSSAAGAGGWPVGNFGQFENHGTYTDFNTVPNYWGWNYVQGSTNAPNATSSQWYRQNISLGANYPGRGAGGYSLELAYPRYNHSTAGVWMRTVENGTIGSWYRIDGGSSGWGLTGNAGTNNGTDYCGTSDAVAFSLGTSGTRRLTVSSTGNVGIGTTGPGFKLDIVVPASVTPGDSMYGQELTDGTRFMRLYPGTLGAQSWNNITKNFDNAIIYNTGGAFTIAPWTGGPSGIRIEGNNGLVGIGMSYLSSYTYKLEVNGTTQCSGNSWTSDIRKKKNIRNLDLNGLDIVKKLRPVTYEWNEIMDAGMEGTQMGFIAQEIEKLMPSMVLTKKDSIGSKGVKYIEMFPVLVKAIQEQQQIIDKQRTDIEALKVENQQIKASVELLLKNNNLSASPTAENKK